MLDIFRDTVYSLCITFDPVMSRLWYRYVDPRHRRQQHVNFTVYIVSCRPVSLYVQLTSYVCIKSSLKHNKFLARSSPPR